MVFTYCCLLLPAGSHSAVRWTKRRCQSVPGAWRCQLTSNTALKNSTNLTLDGCVQALKKMVHEMRAMFPNAESLVRLLLVNPASSAMAERSFSALRRLKTYLRATYSQQHLNNLALCSVHKDIMDTLDINKLMKDFILSKHARVILFGHIE